ncbi:MAG TPA: tetratricopeptide repeat protein [Candidatus Polarisedimenticolia bacterium]
MDLNGLKDFVKDLTQSSEKRAVAKALKFFSKGQLDKAIEVLKEAHEKAPENPEILFEQARILTAAGRGVEAAEALRSVLRRSPRSFDRVNELIEEVRAHHQNVSPLYDAVAEHFVRKGDLKSALGAMERIKPDELRSFLARHRGKWEQLRKNAPDAKMAAASLHAAYSLALGHEVLQEYEAAATIYRTVARNNPDETAHLLPRLENLMAKDYHNAGLRLQIAGLLLQAGRMDEGAQQLSLTLDTDERSAGAVAEAIEAHLKSGGETPELRFTLAVALKKTGKLPGAIEVLRPMVEAGALLDQVIAFLQPLAPDDKTGAARRLLSAALLRRGQEGSALETLLQAAEEDGLASIRSPLESFVAAHPKNVRALHLLSDLHLAEKRGGQAIECLRAVRELAPGEETVLVPKVMRALEADPLSPDAHLLLADIVLHAGEMERGLVVLRHFVRVAPAQAEAALARFAGVIKDDPRSPRARLGALEACLEMRRFPEALDHLRALAGAHPDLTAEFLHAVAQLAEAAPDLHAGIAGVLHDLAPRSPLPAAVRFALGEAAFHGGDPAAAASAFREVLEMAPEHAGEVRQALERINRDDPRAAEARSLLATLYLDARDHAAAIAELSRGGTINPGLLERVLAKYQEILNSDPEDEAARGGYVRTLLLAKRYDDVLAVGQEALKRRDDASTAPIALAIGDALLEKGDTGTAVKRFYAAFSRDRSLFAEVVSRLRRTIQSEGSLALASLALGKVLGAEGKGSEAVEAFRDASTSDPKLRDTVLTELETLQTTCPGDPQPGLLRLSLLREGRDTQRSLKAISSLLDSHPDLAPVLTEHLEQILKGDPKQPFALYEMGRALQRVNQHARSAGTYLTAFRQDATLGTMVLKRLQEMIETAPTALEPYLAACAVHAAKGKFQAAAETIQQALFKIPRELDRLLPRLEEIWKQNRSAPQIALVFGQASLKAERYDKSLAAFEEAAQRDSALFDAAFEGFEAIVNAQPKMGPAYLARGRAHASRMRVDMALADFDRAARLDAELLPAIVQDLEALRTRLPDSFPCALLLGDLTLALGKDNEAIRLYQEELDKGWGRSERLSLLIRLWRMAAAAQDDDAARRHLEEASRLAPDRSQFLTRVHDVHLAQLRAQAARLRDRAAGASRRGSDLQMALRALIDLGEIGEAETLLDAQQAGIDPQEATRARAEIALRRGDYARAAEQLKTLGPSRALAFGAARSGDFALAVQTLELLAAESGDPSLRVALDRAYRSMVVSDLAGAPRPLQAETDLRFGAEAAA